jgi:hypothetical protein
MDDQNADNTELTTKRIRESLHFKIVVGIAAAFFMLIILAIVVNFSWPFIKDLF